MAITFFEERKRQKYLILLFGILTLLILGVIWYSFFRAEQVPPLPEEVSKPPEITINFEVLKSPTLEEFQPFEPIPSLEKEAIEKGEEVKIGRENPFVPYGIETETETETTE